jgi:hypothetical protein
MVTPSAEESDTGYALKSECTICGWNDIDTTQEDGMVIYKESFKARAIIFPQLDPNFRYDPALRRTSKIACPNTECPGTAEPEVAIYTYNQDRVDGYVCVYCNTQWHPS